MPRPRRRETGRRGRKGDAGRRVASPEPAREVDVLALDEALDRLKALDGTQAQIVELRFFGGLTMEETADVLGPLPFGRARLALREGLALPRAQSGMTPERWKEVRHLFDRASELDPRKRDR